MAGWKIVLHAERPEHPRIGDLFPAPWLVRLESSAWVSRKYREKFAQSRLPLVLVLPDQRCGQTEWCIDGPDNIGGEAKGTGWDVVGTAPALTIMPSINIHDGYHGWVTGGVITEDVEGRLFPGVPRTA